MGASGFGALTAPPKDSRSEGREQLFFGGHGVLLRFLEIYLYKNKKCNISDKMLHFFIYTFNIGHSGQYLTPEIEKELKKRKAFVGKRSVFPAFFVDATFYQNGCICLTGESGAPIVFRQEGEKGARRRSSSWTATKTRRFYAEIDCQTGRIFADI